MSPKIRNDDPMPLRQFAEVLHRRSGTPRAESPDTTCATTSPPGTVNAMTTATTAPTADRLDVLRIQIADLIADARQLHASLPDEDRYRDAGWPDWDYVATIADEHWREPVAARERITLNMINVGEAVTSGEVCDRLVAAGYSPRSFTPQAVSRHLMAKRRTGYIEQIERSGQKNLHRRLR